MQNARRQRLKINPSARPDRAFFVLGLKK